MARPSPTPAPSAGESSRRWNAANTASASAAGMPGPRSMIAQLDQPGMRAAGDARPARRPASSAARSARGWRRPVPAGRRRRSTVGQVGRHVDVERRIVRRGVVERAQHDVVERRPARRAPAARRPAAGTGRAGSSRDRSAGRATSSALASSSARSASDHATSAASRLDTAALADAIGVRRSWLTALSSAVRARSDSASGSTALAASASSRCR